jgi:hypothetical protein
VSAEQVQEALLRLVRYPTCHRGEETDAFVAGFDLDPREEWQVRALASSFYVTKFGLAQRRIRFEKSIASAFPATVRLLGDACAERIFGERFEPAHPTLGVADIAGEFVRWFLASFETLRAELGLPEWLGDVLRYEMAAFTTFGEFRQQTWRVPPGAVLRHDAPFTIVELEFDVDPFVETLLALEVGAPAPRGGPARQRTTFLFARVPVAGADEEYLCHRCVIDSAMSAFLQAQCDGRTTVERPDAYGMLVELGICIDQRVSASGPSAS